MMQILSFYKLTKIQKNNIKIKELKIPFEIAFGTTNTITRIETMLKWNEMTSSQKLLIQSSFSSIFGFKIVSIP